ncbi:hypothetical protein R1sor_009039 [Riccia sorocarpa]|uniref:Uncharacterized protein n=1 Tax=Riccia sorocarpa TaxID=122646 RepID=A0ABD3H858_9MARC
MENPRAIVLWDPSQATPSSVMFDIERNDLGADCCKLNLPIRFPDLPKRKENSPPHSSPSNAPPQPEPSPSLRLRAAEGRPQRWALIPLLGPPRFPTSHDPTFFGPSDIPPASVITEIVDDDTPIQRTGSLRM